jgi:predicted CopG family antitoxin
MKTISIRVEDDVFNKIEKLRGNKSKSDFCREILEDNIDKNEDNGLQKEDNLLQNEDGLKTLYENSIGENITLKADLQHSAELLIAKNDLIKNLESQNGFLISEHDRLARLNDRLLLSSAPEEKIERKWWEFWK